MRVIFVLAMLVLLGAASALPQNSTYLNHGLFFKIPESWSVAKDQADDNETKLVVADNMSAIRIDILNKDYLSKLDKGKGYGSSEYNSYKDNVVKTKKHMCLEGGGFPIGSHNISNLDVGVSCDESDGFAEWVLLWFPSDENKVIGVHALLKAIYPTTKILWGSHGYMETYIHMPDPLFDLLASISLSDRQKKQTNMKRKINCDESKELDLGDGSTLSLEGLV